MSLNDPLAGMVGISNQLPYLLPGYYYPCPDNRPYRERLEERLKSNLEYIARKKERMKILGKH